MVLHPGLIVRELTKTYHGKSLPALSGVNLEIHSGEVFGLIGPNGAGKTTFLCCLLGLLKPDFGEILIDGMYVDDLRVKAQFGYVPERLQFEPWINGFDLVSFHHALAGGSRQACKTSVELRLNQVGLEEAAWFKLVKTYSRGMLQRIALAQALIGNPKYLFLDEPTSGMDPSGVMQVRKIIQELKDKGTTIILNSHQLDQVERICDKVAFLRGGKVQTIEVPTVGSEASHVIRIRLMGEISRELLVKVAELVNARLVGFGLNEAKFEVAHDKASAELLSALSQNGVHFIEAIPEQNRLERLFFASETSSK
ncbi:MAG: ABC transporter ATP-binding protein [Deltaproteobacteria bacterium]|nr:ABC transporter ATP-binding protein [Deltaproteobacteria bacterium]